MLQFPRHDSNESSAYNFCDSSYSREGGLPLLDGFGVYDPSGGGHSASVSSRPLSFAPSSAASSTSFSYLASTPRLLGSSTTRQRISHPLLCKAKTSRSANTSLPFRCSRHAFDASSQPIPEALPLAPSPPSSPSSTTCRQTLLTGSARTPKMTVRRPSSSDLSRSFVVPFQALTRSYIPSRP
jgi:hypothetical protein